VWHLSEAAFWIGLATPGVAFLVIITIALAYAIVRPRREHKEPATKAEGTPSGVSYSSATPAVH
jgi:hypothetical protein